MIKDVLYYKKIIYKDIALLAAMSIIFIIGGAAADSELIVLSSMGFLIVQFILMKIKQEKN